MWRSVVVTSIILLFSIGVGCNQPAPTPDETLIPTAEDAVAKVQEVLGNRTFLAVSGALVSAPVYISCLESVSSYYETVRGFAISPPEEPPLWTAERQSDGSLLVRASHPDAESESKDTVAIVTPSGNVAITKGYC